MLGGSIFVLFAFAVEIGQGTTPWAFGVAGFVALLTSYSYLRLSLAYPSEGGTITFLNHAFGRGLFSSVVNTFLWLSYMVILALYAHAFSTYALWFIPMTWHFLFRPIITGGIILVLLVINILGVGTVGRAQIGLVLIQMLLLIPFIAVGLLNITQYGHQFFIGIFPVGILAAGMIIFVCYEGFELIANATLDVKNPETTLPRAYYGSVLVVTTLYILLSLVAIGNFPLNQIIGAQEYALAVVAESIMGLGGFCLIVAAALLSTSSAMNATIYGAAKTSAILAQDQQLPHLFAVKVKNRPLIPLMFIAFVTILIATFCDLYAISIMGSVGFLFIFALVNVANLRLSKHTQSYRIIPQLGILSCAIAIAIVLWFTTFTRPLEIVGIACLALTSLIFQIIYQKVSQKT